ISFSDHQQYQIDVMNTMGQVVSTLNDVTVNGEITTDQLAAGIYFVKARGADGKVINQKLVIN
ncbi:MAG: T9SS type A sorting domain-containing protein, partial [Bacteroidota bacterium]